MKKQYKLFIILTVILFMFIGATYAWQAGAGVKWISEPDNNSRFSGVATIDGVSTYTDTATNLKWEKTTSLSSMQWANSDSYREPTWNGNSYDYPAFKYCTDKGAGWRLPTRKELISIISYTYKNSKGAYSIHPNISTNGFWSSTEYASFTLTAWRADFSNGNLNNNNNKTNNNYVICIHD